MSQTAKQRMTPQLPTFAISRTGVPIKISSRQGIWTLILFCAIAIGAVIGVPLYGFLYHYTWVDWSMFALLYVISGLGITVGYHRLMSHRSFDCPNWVKGALLIGGAWALQNSAIKWAADHLRHHAHCDERKIRTMRSKDSGIATVDGSSPPIDMPIPNMRRVSQTTPLRFGSTSTIPTCSSQA